MSHDQDKGRRALVTGATGYIGRKLVERLVRLGWSVDIVVRQTSDLSSLATVADAITVHRHDGTTEDLVDIVGNARPRVVFHVASQILIQHKPNDIGSLIDSNILFSTQLVEAMTIHDVRHLVNTGTSWQHYEDGDYNPVNLYAATKQAFEDILAYYVEIRGLRATTLALFDTYGSDDPRSKVMALLSRAARTREPLVMSPGEQLIDMVHIDDVVEAFVVAERLLRTQAEGHCIYGVSSGRPVTLKELVREFEIATGCRVPIVFGGRSYRPREVMVPWTRYRRLPGWEPRIDLASGIKALNVAPSSHITDPL